MIGRLGFSIIIVVKAGVNRFTLNKAIVVPRPLLPKAQG